MQVLLRPNLQVKQLCLFKRTWIGSLWRRCTHLLVWAALTSRGLSCLLALCPRAVCAHRQAHRIHHYHAHMSHLCIARMQMLRGRLRLWCPPQLLRHSAVSCRHLTRNTRHTLPRTLWGIVWNICHDVRNPSRRGAVFLHWSTHGTREQTATPQVPKPQRWRSHVNELGRSDVDRGNEGRLKLAAVDCGACHCVVRYKLPPLPTTTTQQQEALIQRAGHKRH